MNRIILFLLMLLTLMPTAQGRPEEMAKAIESLVVQFWPDYDRRSVLVLLTGNLPAGTKLPAGVSIPFPDHARLNAVARIDTTDGVMKDDIFFEEDSGVIRFITPDLRFRAEYYLPYTVNNNQRSFDFAWTADLPVDNFSVRVQRPLAADSISTKPSAQNVFRGEDGFEYHAFPAQRVGAREPYQLHVDYVMSTDQLSVEQLPARKSDSQAPESPSASTSGSAVDWPLLAVLAGGSVIVVSLFGYFVARRSSSGIGKPGPKKFEELDQPLFCKGCGKPVDKEDRFCSQCGKEV